MFTAILLNAKQKSLESNKVQLGVIGESGKMPMIYKQASSASKRIPLYQVMFVIGVTLLAIAATTMCVMFLPCG